jgi:hypothetical protein
MNKPSMINTVWDWYASIPAIRRRILVAVLVPVQDYLFLEPSRNVFNALVRFSPALAIASLPLLLLVGLLTAVVTCLFVVEYLAGVGKHVKNKAVGYLLFCLVMGWAFLPFPLIAHR